MPKKPLLTVGWREWLELPELTFKLRAKVDTGAASSALHALAVKIDESGDAPQVSFRLQGRKGKLELPLHDLRRIKSSNGKSELRPVIRTALKLGGRNFKIDLTLTKRGGMKFPMLLGREALRGRAVVDVSRSYALGIPIDKGEA